MIFEKKGWENTPVVAQLACDYAREHGIRHVVLASKTGYTAEAMNCCASAGKTPDGRSVICVTANAWTGEFCIEDHIALDSKYCGSAESE